MWGRNKLYALLLGKKKAVRIKFGEEKSRMRYFWGRKKPSALNLGKKKAARVIFGEEKCRARYLYVSGSIWQERTYRGRQTYSWGRLGTFCTPG